MTGRGWRVGGSVFAVVVLLIGTLVVASSMTPRSSQGTAGYTGVSRIVVDSRGGTVTARGGATVTVRWRATSALSTPSVEARQDGGTLTLTAVCGGTGVVRISVSCAVAYEIEIPPQTSLTVTDPG